MTNGFDNTSTLMKAVAALAATPRMETIKNKKGKSNETAENE